ncbi:MAG: hypothetical protein M3O36_04765, partial [Myxococcota bacterium]|nr:hypothetical protein [Myxococcota bacterium]
MHARWSGSRWTRVALCTFAALGIFYRDTEANGAPRIHLKGDARLDASVARDAGKVSVSGALIDDAGQPIPGAAIALVLARPRTPTAEPGAFDVPEPLNAPDPVASVVLAATMPQACENGARPVLERGDLLVLRTDERGRFCVRLTLTTDRYVARLDARPSEHLEGAHLDLPVDLARASVALRFDPEPLLWALSLDEESTTIDAVASRVDDGAVSAAGGMLLSLSNEAGKLLDTSTTDVSGRVRFHVVTARLGEPGPGELRLAFGGTTEAGASSHAVRIERRTHVTLAVREARGANPDPRGRLAVGSPEEGIPLVVSAEPRCAKAFVGSPTGTIVARVGGAVVGAAPLQRGQARLVMTFAMPSTGEVPVDIRYLPDAPWLEADDGLSLLQPVRAAIPWREATLLLAAAAVVVWLAFTRSQSRGGASGQSGVLPGEPSRLARRAVVSGARVELVREAESARCWTGLVTDAYDDVALAGARVSLERPGFRHVEIIAETVSDEGGVFVLPSVGAKPGDELVCEGRLHAALR